MDIGNVIAAVVVLAVLGAVFGFILAVALSLIHIYFGAPCTPLVKAGDHVKVGQKIGEFHGLGAPIHASVSGTVKAVEPRPYSMGGNITTVVIENDMQDEEMCIRDRYRAKR